MNKLVELVAARACQNILQALDRLADMKISVSEYLETADSRNSDYFSKAYTTADENLRDALKWLEALRDS